MGKSRRIRLGDLRDLYLLVGECRELGRNWRAWRLRMSEGLGRIVPSRAIVSGEIVRDGRDPRGLQALFVLSKGREMSCGHSGLTRLGQHGSIRIARRLCAPDEDRHWYADPPRANARCANCAACLFAHGRTRPSAGISRFFLSLFRTRSDEGYTARDRGMVLLLVREIAVRLGEELATSVARPGFGLSPRLRQVLRLLGEGLSEKQVARRLGISPHTVHDHVKRLHRHFGVGSRAALLVTCFKQHAGQARGASRASGTGSPPRGPLSPSSPRATAVRNGTSPAVAQ